MIDSGTGYFMCDECPICEGTDHRLRLAQEGDYAPQLECCGCDKVQTEFFQSGYCEDACIAKPRKRKTGKRRTGSAYRGEMELKHRKNLTWIIYNCGYNPAVGYIKGDWVDGVWQYVGKHIKHPKNSNAQQYWKRYSDKIVRKKKELFQGNKYRKCFDYWWTLY